MSNLPIGRRVKFSTADIAVRQYLAANDYKFEINLLESGMQRNDGGNRVMDAWVIYIDTKTGESVRTRFEFFTGTGQRLKPKHNYDTEYVVRPELANVLRCFLLDASLGAESFKDFCDNCGYDSDSISAFKVHQQCIETATKLQRLFPTQIRNDLSNLLEDY